MMFSIVRVLAIFIFAIIAIAIAVRLFFIVKYFIRYSAQVNQKRLIKTKSIDEILQIWQQRNRLFKEKEMCLGSYIIIIMELAPFSNWKNG